jgi:hypothetical protein
LPTDKQPPRDPVKEAKRRLIAKRYPPKTRLSAKLSRAAKALYAPVLAFVVVVGTAAAGSGDGDWALLIPGEKPICAKSEATCYAARDAIGAGRWTPLGIDRSYLNASIAFIDCKPSPGCFPAASLTIPGFNAPK